MPDRATPTLPSRDFAATSAFYSALGFTESYRDDGWMILSHGGVTLEFFPFADLDSPDLRALLPVLERWLDALPSQGH